MLQSLIPLCNSDYKAATNNNCCIGGNNGLTYLFFVFVNNQHNQKRKMVLTLFLQEGFVFNTSWEKNSSIVVLVVSIYIYY